MVDVLDEVTSGDLTFDHVRHRVEDWERRILDLYARMQAWLPDGFATERRRTKRMYEELMREVGVGARELPLLDILRDRHGFATVEPRGLWIVGANGRLDLTSEDRHHVIVDVAANFELPDWRISPLSDRRKLEALQRESFLSGLGCAT